MPGSPDAEPGRVQQIASQQENHVLLIVIDGPHAIDFSHPRGELTNVSRLFMADKPII